MSAKTLSSQIRRKTVGQVQKIIDALPATSPGSSLMEERSSPWEMAVGSCPTIVSASIVYREVEPSEFTDYTKTKAGECVNRK